MDYRSVLAANAAPAGVGAVPAVVRDGGPARRLRDALEPIATHAIWSARTNNELTARFGLDFLGAYVWGRASALGEPAAAVVAAAFAVFQPNLIVGVYQAARAKADWSDLVARRDQATAESLRDLLGDTDVTGVTAVLRRGIDAADGSGRPMFAGLAGRPWPEDPYGQLWRACDLVREHRGDSHIAAFVAAGRDGVEMNVLTERWLGLPLYSYSATRGWSRRQLEAAVDRLRSRDLLADDALSEEGHRVRAGIEGDTDTGQQRLVAAIGADLDAVVARLAAWSDRLVSAGAFPTSVHKRAAG